MQGKETLESAPEGDTCAACLRLRNEASARQISENGVDGDQDEKHDDRWLPSSPCGLPGIEPEYYERDRKKKVAP